MQFCLVLTHCLQTSVDKNQTTLYGRAAERLQTQVKVCSITPGRDDAFGVAFEASLRSFGSGVFAPKSM